jgi:hypothetical protein
MNPSSLAVARSGCYFFDSDLFSPSGLMAEFQSAI